MREANLLHVNAGFVLTHRYRVISTPALTPRGPGDLSPKSRSTEWVNPHPIGIRVAG